MRINQQSLKLLGFLLVRQRRGRKLQLFSVSNMLAHGLSRQIGVAGPDGVKKRAVTCQRQAELFGAKQPEDAE